MYQRPSWLDRETARYAARLAEEGPPEPNWLGKMPPRTALIITDKIYSLARLPPVLHLAGKCECPVHVTVMAHDHVMPCTLSKSADTPASTVLRLVIAPCKKCEWCKLVKMLGWTERNLVEILLSPAAWMVTLSFEDTWFRHCETSEARLKVVRRMLTLYLKNIREKWPHCPLRFAAVVEAGEKNGRLHIHAIVVQTNTAAGVLPDQALRQRVLDPMVSENRRKIEQQRRLRANGLPWKKIFPIRENRRGQWICGFTKVKRIANGLHSRLKAARYVSKYINKSPVCRIRASIRWGRSHEFHRLDRDTGEYVHKLPRKDEDGKLVAVPQEAEQETAEQAFARAVLVLRHQAAAAAAAVERQQQPDWCIRAAPEGRAVTWVSDNQVADFVRDAYGATGPPDEHAELAGMISGAFGDELDRQIERHSHQKKLSDMSEAEFEDWLAAYAGQFATQPRHE